ncbi:MAG: hypothetical protein JWM86_689 [Thermoleophilia bacterium]|nr:hypothetical protein [Thermoleophilia bacterium]
MLISLLAAVAMLVGPASAEAITVSGTAMKDELGQTWQGCDGTTPNLKIAVGAAVAGTTTCNATTGVFTFSGITIPAIGSRVVIWFDGAPAKGALYTTAAATGTNITGLTPTQDRVWIRSEQGAVTLTAAFITGVDKALDPDIPLDASTHWFDLPAAMELHVDSPVTLDLHDGGYDDWGADAGSIHIESGATYSAGSWNGNNAYVRANGTLGCDQGPGVMRPLCIESGGTFTPNSGMLHYMGQTGTYTITATTYHDLYVEGAKGSLGIIGTAAAQTLTTSGGIALKSPMTSDPYGSTINAGYAYIDGYAQSSGVYTNPTWTGQSAFTATFNFGFDGGGTVDLPNADVVLALTATRADFGPRNGYELSPSWEFNSITVRNTGYFRSVFGTAGTSAAVNSPTGTPLDAPVAVAAGWNGSSWALYRLGQNGGDWGIVKYNNDGTVDSDWDDGDAYPNVVDSDGDGIRVFNSGAANVDIPYDIATNGNDIVVVGSSVGNWMIRKYDGDGALDTGFAGTGVISWDGGNANDEARAIMWKGSYMAVAGSAGATYGWRMRAYSNTGVFDNMLSWNNGGVNAEVRGMCSIDDGGNSLYIVGTVGVAGSRDWAIKKTTWDWSAWDTFGATTAANAWTWNPGGTEDQAVDCSDERSDQLTVVGTTGTGALDDGVVRAFYGSGYANTGWGTSGVAQFGTAGVDDDLYAIDGDPYGENVVVAGRDPANGGQGILRALDADGKLDTSWGTNGTNIYDGGAGTDESFRALSINDDGFANVGAIVPSNGGDGVLRRYDFNGDLMSSAVAGTARVQFRNGWDGDSRIYVNDFFTVGQAGDAGVALADLESYDSRVESRGFVTVTGSRGALRASSINPLVSHNDMVILGAFWANQGDVRMESQDYRAELRVGASTTFNNLSVVGGDKIVALEETNPIRVNGVFTARGTSCTNPIQLTSRVGANDWTLDLSGGGTVNVQYADMANATASAAVANTNSRNISGNTNWTFNSPCAGSTVIAPNGLYVDGVAHPVSSNPAPILQWFNRTGTTVDKADVEVLSSPKSNQVALWRLDNSLVDSSAGTWPLTANTAATYTSSGRFGQAASANSTHQGYGFGDLDLPGDYTIDGWVKADLTNPYTQPDIIYKGNAGGSLINYRLGFDTTTDEIQAEFTGGAGAESVMASADASMFNDNGWHHVAMVQASYRNFLYVDGVLMASSSSDYLATDVGAWTGVVAYQLGGSVDDLRVSSVAYGTGDIRGFYRTGRRHAETVWDSDPSDVNGTAVTNCGMPAYTAAPCAASNRTNVSYGGGAGTLQLDGARYWTRARFKTTPGAIWSNWSDYDYWDTAQTLTTSVTSGANVALGGGGASVPGVDLTGTATFQVQTSNVHGYTAYVSGPSDTWAMSDGLTGANHTIPGRGTAGATPASWAPGTAGFFGVSVLGATGGKDPFRWGAGIDFSNLSALNWGWGSASAPLMLNTRSVYDGGPQQIDVGIRANPQLSLDPGSYSTTLVFTAVPNV